MEEVVVLCGRPRLGCRFRRNGPEVIAGRCRSAQRRVRAAVLRLLLTPALARNLHRTAAQHRVQIAHREGDVRRERALGPLAGDVILEARRSPFAGGVIEDSLLGDGCKGDHRIDGQRLPGLEAVFQLIGKH